jgi:hypothetical protein
MRVRSAISNIALAGNDPRFKVENIIIDGIAISAVIYVLVSADDGDTNQNLIPYKTYP